MSARTPDWDIAKLEESIEKAKAMKSISPCSSNSSIDCSCTCPIFSHFFIIGIPPAEKLENKPQILVSYPPTVPTALNLKQIIQFSFPTGPMRDYLHGSQDSTLADEFIFKIKISTNAYYGVCLHTYSNPDHYPFFSSQNTKSFAYCLCLLTQAPVFSAHFTFLSYLALLCSNKIDCPPINIQPPVIEPFGPLVPDCLVNQGIAFNSAINVPNSFRNLLFLYRSTSPCSTPVFLVPTMQLFFPNQCDGKSVLWACIDTLFTVLTPEAVLFLITAIFLDCQILIIGSNLHEISTVVVALEAFLDPLHFSGLAIPVLPKGPESISLLNMPVPFIIGCAPCPELLNVDFLDSAIFVNIDKKFSPPSDAIPSFPNQSKIISQLKAIISKIDTKGINSFAFPEAFRSKMRQKYSFTTSNIDAIVSLIKEPLSCFLTDYIESFFATDITGEEKFTVFNKDLFIKMAPEHNRQFFERLLESQTFQTYLDERIHNYSVRNGFKSLGAKPRSRKMQRHTSKRLSLLDIEPEEISAMVAGLKQ